MLGGLFVALLISVALSLSYSFPDSLPLSLAVVMSVCVRERGNTRSSRIVVVVVGFIGVRSTLVVEV